MKKKLSRAEVPLPKFPSDEAAAEYFDSHAVAGVWEQLPEVKPLTLSRSLAKTIQTRRASAKSPVSIRLEPDQIAAARKIAASKSVGYQKQLQMWIIEGIRREGRRKPS